MTSAIKRSIKSIFMACTGNVVEWYDFYIYSFMSIYFAPSFFPKSDSTVQLIESAGIFALGFMMRPIGSYVFGKIADTKGRRTSLVASVILMGLGSCLIAFIPTYEQIGIYAPILLLVGRLIQGLALGGEYGATATYMSEVAIEGRRGFLSSFQATSITLGQLLAIAVLGVLQLSFTSEELTSWAWRLPFAVGGIAALLSLFSRLRLHETATQTRHKEAGSLRVLWENHKKPLFIVSAYTASGSLSFYVFTTYMQKYLIQVNGFDKPTVTWIMSGVLVFFTLIIPLLGALSDKIGRKGNMLIFSTLGLLFFFPILDNIGSQDITGVFLLLCSAISIIACYLSIGAIVKAETFPPHVRAMGVGVPYAISNAIFGGTAEYLALSSRLYGLERYFYMYIIAVMTISLIAAIMMPKTPEYLNKQSVA